MFRHMFQVVGITIINIEFLKVWGRDNSFEHLFLKMMGKCKINHLSLLEVPEAIDGQERMLRIQVLSDSQSVLVNK